MPVVATPTGALAAVISMTGPLTIHEVRMFMQDFPDQNILIDGVEFSDEAIQQAMNMALMQFNAITPLTQYSWEGFPVGLKFLGLLGVSAYLLQSAAIGFLRNGIGYQDGDISVQLNDKWNSYLQLSGQLRSEWMQTAKEAKISHNLEGGYDYLGSPYAHYYRSIYTDGSLIQ